MGRLLAMITSAGIGIACLGLFGLAFLVAMGTVGIQGIRATLANPVDSLRNE